MSLDEIIAELPRLTSEELHVLIRRALELVEERLAAHHDDPSSSIPLDQLKNQLGS